MSDPFVVKLRLSMMGRPLKSYTFDKTTISVGRDPESDIFVDNPGVSRDHFRLERGPSGEYEVIDLGSANGTLVNDQPVQRSVLHNNDVVRFGKYTLWVGYEHDRRLGVEEHHAAVDNERRTVILSREELGKMMEVAKVKEAHPAPPPAVLQPPARPAAPPAPIAAILISFLLGVALGAGGLWLYLTKR